jgi:hypothetical protein
MPVIRDADMDSKSFYSPNTRCREMINGMKYLILLTIINSFKKSIQSFSLSQTSKV